MFNNYDFKYIIKRIIIGVAIAFILFNINKCNAFALVYKGKDYNNSFVQREKAGTLNVTNRINVIRFEWVTPIDKDLYNGIDLFAIKFDRLNFSRISDYSIDNPYLNGPYNGYYFSCTYSGTGYCQNANIIPQGGSSVSQDLFGSINSGDITIVGYVLQDGGAYNPCWFSSEVENSLICPFVEDNIKYLDVEISYSGFDTISYDLFVGNMKVLYNYDSTEIVNALSQVQQSQNDTTTAINDTLDTINDSNTTSSSNSGNSALSGFNSSITSGINDSVDATSLYSLLTNFTNQLSDTTCQPIVIPIPYTNENLTLPCLGTEFATRIPLIWNVYQLVILGAFALAMWQNATEFIFKVLDPYYAGANNIPLGGGK